MIDHGVTFGVCFVATSVLFFVLMEQAEHFLLCACVCEVIFGLVGRRFFLPDERLVVDRCYINPTDRPIDQPSLCFLFLGFCSCVLLLELLGICEVAY